MPRAYDYDFLINTALFQRSLPSKMLSSALERQRAEIPSEDSISHSKLRLRARTMVMKAYFEYKEGEEMNEDTHPNIRNRAYLYGRLLAMLSRIHRYAHGGKSASDPGNRLYGAASKTPGLVFPRLCQLAQYHFQKMGKADADKLGDGIRERLHGLHTIGGFLKEVPPYAVFEPYLELSDQGRFAIGYYYERSLDRQWSSELKKGLNLDSAEESVDVVENEEETEDTHDK